MKTRNIRNILFLVLFAFAAFSLPAAARDSEGKLLFITEPISTHPHFAKPGGELYVDVAKAVHDNCSCPFHLFIMVNGVRHEVWGYERIADPASGTYRFKTKVPDDVPPGFYDLEASKGANHDSSRRAVVIVKDFPQNYTILHITDVHVGREAYPGAKAGNTLLLDAMPEIANKLKPDLVIITGDITHKAEPEQFKRFLDALDKFEEPTFVQTGNHDGLHNPGEVQKYLGSSNYDFTYGKSFFISVDTAGNIVFPDDTGRVAWIKSELDVHQDAAFKVLFTHKILDKIPQKLFKAIAPDKLDLVLMGHTHMNNKEKIKGTLIITTGAYADGAYRVINIENNTFSSEKLFSISMKDNKYAIKTEKSQSKVKEESEEEK